MGKKGPMATSSKFHQCKINPCKIGCKVWPNMATLVVVGKFVANIIIAFLCLFQYPFLSMNIPFSLCLSLTILLWLSLKYIIFLAFFNIFLCLICRLLFMWDYFFWNIWFLVYLFFNFAFFSFVDGFKTRDSLRRVETWCLQSKCLSSTEHLDLN